MTEDLSELPRTKKEAYKAGAKFFFTGRPCLRGHVSKRYRTSWACFECVQLLPPQEWHKRNPEKYVAYRDSNRLEFNKRRLSRHKERVQQDPVYATMCRIRGLVSASLRRRGYGKRSKTGQIIGCTWDEFARHVELQFLPGMSWENMHLWEIDHIVPLATASTEAEVLALNHFTNLRPLWAKENRSKRDKITHLI